MQRATYLIDSVTEADKSWLHLHLHCIFTRIRTQYKDLTVSPAVNQCLGHSFQLKPTLRIFIPFANIAIF